MPNTSAVAVPKSEQYPARIVPMFVCGGCRPEPLGYALLEVGDNLEEIVGCPMRELCTWYAAHDLGETCHYNEQDEAAMVAPLFRMDPYFSCPNFHDYSKFLSRNGLTARAPALAK